MELDLLKFNKIDILPISQDILLVRNYLDISIKCCLEKYQNGAGDAVESKKILACKVTIFNKRRGGEFVSSTREEVKSALLHSNVGITEISELVASLTPIEQFLSTHMTLIKLKGKQNRGVPVLMHPNDVSLLKCLLDDQSLENETFLFQSRKKSPFHSHTLLSQMTVRIEGLQCPKAIRY